MMLWRLIDKTKTIRPTTVGYAAWKPDLAEEGFHQCVYCAIDENTFGSIRNYHVEHYRPKALPQFKHLRVDFDNLFYACSICNGFKGDDWRDNDADVLNVVGYPDPSKTDYADLFDVDEGGLASGRFVSSEYIVRRLYLNRPQLISYRRKRAIDQLFDELRPRLSAQMDELLDLVVNGDVIAKELMKDAKNKGNNAIDCLVKLGRTVPHTAEQIKRQAV